MRQSKAEIYLHLVWATSNRLPWIGPEIERAVYRSIQQEAQRLHCAVLAIGGIANHVHLVVKLPTRLSAAELMKQVKGVSSRFISEQLPGNEGFRWQEGYGVFSVGVNQVKHIVAYVENQKQHHADGTLYPLWEETDEEYTHSPAE